MQQNPTVKLITQIVFLLSSVAHKRCHSGITKKYFGQWKIWNPQMQLVNGIAVFVHEFDATHSLQQWVFAHDASLRPSISNSDEWYGISKSDEFPSFIKFDMWFCDSLVNLPYSKSIHLQNQRCHQCVHCEVRRFPDALSSCQRFLNFLYNWFRPETVQTLPRNSLTSFRTIIVVQIFIKIRS